MRNLLERIERTWCETTHGQVMWPIHGHYRCSTCLREYSVGFEQAEQPPAPPIVWGSSIKEAL
jgi:hypothetical protein